MLNEKCLNYRLPPIQKSLAEMWEYLTGEPEIGSFYKVKKISDSVGLARIDDDHYARIRFYVVPLAADEDVIQKRCLPGGVVPTPPVS